VGFGIKDCDSSQDGNGHVVAGVIEAGQNASNGHETKACHDMHLEASSPKKDGPQMIVFTQQKLDWMDIDGVIATSAWCFLMMMMFMYVSVDCFDV